MNKTEISAKLIIIGSGPAGFTAAIYAARANLEPIILAGQEPGGQLTITTDVENFPGFANTIQGPWLMEQMEEQARKVGTKILYEYATEVDFGERPFRITTSKAKYLADSVIIATGAAARWLGIPSEKIFQGYGISGCATCDGFFFKGLEVAVIGGGNTAAEEAIYLTNHASRVYLIHRKGEMRAEKILQDRLFKNPKIEPIWHQEVEEFIGETKPEKKLTAIKLRDLRNGNSKLLEVGGAFVAIGHSPNSAIFKDYLKLDKDGYIIEDHTKTNIDGVFVAGDVADKIYRQAVTAAGTGCMAALEVQKFLDLKL